MKLNDKSGSYYKMKLFLLILTFSCAFSYDFYEYDFPNNFEASLVNFQDYPCDNDYHTYLRLFNSHIKF